MTRRLLFSFACLLASTAGCGRSNRGSVQLTQLCANPTPAADGCTFSSGTCDKVSAVGVLGVDLALTRDTLVYPIQIDNERLDNSDTSTGRTNTNNAFIERFDMRYEVPGVTLSASSSQAGFVPAGGSTVLVAVLIPPDAGAVLATAVGAGSANAIVHVKAHGRYGDDTEFDTAEFSVPVVIVNGATDAFACTGTDAGKTPACCPQDGQTAACTCL
jgi:hypothetical protein